MNKVWVHQNKVDKYDSDFLKKFWNLSNAGNIYQGCWPWVPFLAKVSLWAESHWNGEQKICLLIILLGIVQIWILGAPQKKFAKAKTRAKEVLDACPMCAWLKSFGNLLIGHGGLLMRTERVWQVKLQHGLYASRRVTGQFLRVRWRHLKHGQRVNQ